MGQGIHTQLFFIKTSVFSPGGSSNTIFRIYLFEGGDTATELVACLENCGSTDRAADRPGPWFVGKIVRGILPAAPSSGPDKVHMVGTFKLHFWALELGNCINWHSLLDDFSLVTHHRCEA